MLQLASPPERRSHWYLLLRIVEKVAILSKEMREIAMIYRLGMEGLADFDFILVTC